MSLVPLNLQQMLSPFLNSYVSTRGTVEQVSPLPRCSPGSNSRIPFSNSVLFAGSTDIFPEGMLGSRSNRGSRNQPHRGHDLSAMTNLSDTTPKTSSPSRFRSTSILPELDKSPIATHPGSARTGFCDVFPSGTACSVESDQSVSNTTRGRP